MTKCSRENSELSYAYQWTNCDSMAKSILGFESVEKKQDEERWVKLMGQSSSLSCGAPGRF